MRCGFKKQPSIYQVVFASVWVYSVINSGGCFIARNLCLTKRAVIQLYPFLSYYLLSLSLHEEGDTNVKVYERRVASRYSHSIRGLGLLDSHCCCVPPEKPNEAHKKSESDTMDN